MSRTVSSAANPVAPDAHAIATLRRAGFEPALLAEMLERLQASHPKAGFDAKVLDYISSHPPTPERIRQIRGQ